MPSRLPDPSLTRRAIEIYLSRAFQNAPSPAATKLLSALMNLDDRDFFLADAFERDDPEEPGRWSLRLGNDQYPFMKLKIDRRPDAQGFLYDVDTHDMHIAPAMGSPEFEEFQALMRANKEIAGAVQQLWQAEGIPTFKTWLAEDLARRRREAGP